MSVGVRLSKAAEALYLSQPAVSESIASVEDELGIKFFRRSHRGIALTDDGEIFAAYARNILRNASLMENIGNQEKKCRVVPHCPIHTALHECFVGFCKDHRDSDYIQIRLSNRFYQIEEAEKEIQAGERDISVAHCTPSVYEAMKHKLDMRGIFSAKLVTMPLQVFVSRNHPMALTGVRKEDLKNYICIHDVDPSAMAMYISSELVEALSWERMIRAERRETRLKLVSEGLGYEVGPPLPADVLEKYELTMLPSPCGEYSLICLCSRNRMSDPNVRDLLDRILNLFGLAAEALS